MTPKTLFRHSISLVASALYCIALSMIGFACKSDVSPETRATKRTDQKSTKGIANDIPEALQSSSMEFEMSYQTSLRYVDWAAQSAGSSREVIIAWNHAMQIADRSAKLLGKQLDGKTGDQWGTTLDKLKSQTHGLNKELKWCTFEWLGEGTVPVVTLDTNYWMKSAQAFSDGQANRFFELGKRAYGNVSFNGWLNIMDRTWDYGGCSPLGDGKKTHLKILLQVDKVLAGDKKIRRLVSKKVNRLRQSILNDLLKEDDMFPYCERVKDHNENKEASPEGIARILEEMNEIVNQVTLSNREVRRLERRIKSDFLTEPWPESNP